jgi:hypothetical protein
MTADLGENESELVIENRLCLARDEIRRWQRHDRERKGGVECSERRCIVWLEEMRS